MRSCSDINGKDKVNARKNYGIVGFFRRCIRLYQPLVDFAGAGASVPLLGFGNVLWKGIKESVDQYGLIGIFRGGFNSCAVGVSAALVFSYIASLIFKPRMKKK